MSKNPNIAYKQRKTVIIETPERVHLVYEVAGPLQRALATILDLLIIGGAILILYLIQSLIMSLSWTSADFTNESSLEDNFAASGWYASFIVIIIFLIQWGYFAFFEYILHGRTIGKIALGLKVIRSNGMNLDFTSSILRNLVRGIDALPSFYLVAGVVSLLDTRHRRLGDIAADTLVIYLPKQKKVSLSKSTTVNLAPAATVSRVLKPLSEDDLFILRRFLNARVGLGPEQRGEFAQKLKDAAYEKTGLMPIITETDEQYLERVYAGHNNSNTK